MACRPLQSGLLVSRWGENRCPLFGGMCSQQGALCGQPRKLAQGAMAKERFEGEREDKHTALGTMPVTRQLLLI